MFLLWRDDKFYQMLFLHLLRWSYGFCSLLCLYYVLCILICICWTVLASLRWILFDHDEWSLCRTVEFSLLPFCWEFFHLCSSRISVYGLVFFVLVVPFCSFGIRVMLTL
jgi:hypothetical protein